MVTFWSKLAKSADFSGSGAINFHGYGSSRNKLNFPGGSGT